MGRAHSAYYFQLGETTPQNRLVVLEADLPDLRAAMEWSRINAPVGRLRLLEQCLRVARAAGDRAAEAKALHYLGVVRTTEDRTGEAMEVFTESLALRRDLGLVGDVGYSLLWLSVATMRAGALGESAS